MSLVTLSASQLVMMRALDKRPNQNFKPYRPLEQHYRYRSQDAKTVLNEGFRNIEGLDGQLTFSMVPTQNLRGEDRLAVPVRSTTYNARLIPEAANPSSVEPWVLQHTLSY